MEDCEKCHGLGHTQEPQTIEKIGGVKVTEYVTVHCSSCNGEGVIKLIQD